MCVQKDPQLVLLMARTIIPVVGYQLYLLVQTNSRQIQSIRHLTWTAVVQSFVHQTDALNSLDGAIILHVGAKYVIMPFNLCAFERLSALKELFLKKQNASNLYSGNLAASRLLYQVHYYIPYSLVHPLLDGQ